MADACVENTNVYSNETEDTMSVRYNADYSEGYNTCQRNKATIKNSSVKNINLEKIENIPQTPNISRYINIHIEKPKTHVSPVKNARKRSCPKKRAFLRKKFTLAFCRKQNSPPQKHGINAPFPKANYNLKHQNTTICDSSIGGKINGKGDYISPSCAPRSVASVIPLQTTSFEEHCNINRQENLSRYEKQLALISRKSFSPRGNSLCYSGPDATTVSPKLPTSKPFLLRRRIYSCGILSVNDSGACLFRDETKDIAEESNESLKEDSEYSDTYHSSGNSDVFEDSKSCDAENGALRENPALENTSILKVQQPLRVKYVDETTMLTKELVIYSNEFLKRMCEERGKALSKREIFDRIIKQSVDYEGETLHVIRDTKEFQVNLKNASKSQLHTKLSKPTGYQSPQKLTKNATETPRTIHQTPRWIRWWGNTEDKVGMNKRKMSDTEEHSYSSTKDHLFTKNKKVQSKDSTYGTDSFTEDSDQNGQSRMYMKRVNCEEILSSKFRLYFQYYSKLGGRLKSGAVISRTNSHFWLKKCGVISDDATFKIANNSFTAAAKCKIVLNISDYVQYLTSVARTRRIFIMDIIRKLMSIDIDSPSMHDELEKSPQLKRPFSSKKNKNK